MTIGQVERTIVRRGGTVVDVSPPGKTRPLYQDLQHYRTGKVRFKTVERFAPDQFMD